MLHRSVFAAVILWIWTGSMYLVIATKQPHYPRYSTVEFQENTDYCDSYWEGDKRKEDLEILCGGHSNGTELRLCFDDRITHTSSSLPVLVVDRLSNLMIDNLNHFFHDVLWGMASFLALCIPPTVRFNCDFSRLPHQHYYRTSYDDFGPAFFTSAMFANICINQSFEFVQFNNTNTTSFDNTIHISHPLNKHASLGIRPFAFGNTSKDSIYEFFQRGADAVMRSRLSDEKLKMMNPLDDRNINSGDVYDNNSVPLSLTNDRYQANIISFPYYTPVQREIENKDGPVYASLALLRSQYGGKSSSQSSSIAKVIDQKINVVLYSREDASNHRRLLNAVKLCEWIREQLLPPERYNINLVRKLTNLTDSARYLLFKNSHVFIAVHGGYSPNTLFMPPSSLWFNVIIGEDSFREWDFSLHSSKHVEVVAMTDDITLVEKYDAALVPIKRTQVDQHPG